jgi:NitT/TauT family transport system substrate-binding protein
LIGVFAFTALCVLRLGATGTAEEPSTNGSAVSLEPITVGIMPAVDSIPIIVAQEAGFFADEGLAVTIELFRDQLYREASLQSNRIDATVSDLVNAIRSWENGADYRVLTLTQGRFSLLTSSASMVDSIAAWPDEERLETGAIEDSVIFYTAVRMLEEVGADPGRMEIVPTLQIPVRLELLNAGELEAAILPEPVARIAVGAGANEIVDSTVLDWTAGIVIATGAAIDQKREELEAFLRAYNRGVAAFNENPDAYLEAVVATAGFPPPTATTMQVPEFMPAAVPTDAQVADVAEWMLERGLIERVPAQQEIVEELY